MATRQALIDTATRALESARQRDHFIRELESGHGVKPLSPPLPAPIGAYCPDHTTYPLVIREGQAWCRRGQHEPLAGGARAR